MNQIYVLNNKLEQLKVSLEIIEIISLSNVSGSPFYTEEFILGEVFLNAKRIGELLLRYNIYGEEIQVKKDNGSIFALKKLGAINIKINDDLLVYKK